MIAQCHRCGFTQNVMLSMFTKRVKVLWKCCEDAEYYLDNLQYDEPKSVHDWITIPSGTLSDLSFEYFEKDNNGKIVATLKGCERLPICMPRCLSYLDIHDSSIEYLADNLFKDHGITKVMLPDCCTTIGERAFHNCPNLGSVYGNVKEIKSEAFLNCEILTWVGVNVECPVHIGEHAFDNCISLMFLKLWVTQGRYCMTSLRVCGRSTSCTLRFLHRASVA